MQSARFVFPRNEDPGTTTDRGYRIVGEDEADPAQGLITPQAPLARALIGLRVDEEADWRGQSLRIAAIS